MTTLRLISLVLWVPGLVLSLMEWFAPRGFMCDCRTGWMADGHLKSPWLLVIGVCYVTSDLLAIADGRKLPIIAAVGAYYLWRWWKHTKNKWKQLKDKVLGVVRETAAGLKVVPVSGDVS